jgi:hypothetical protein
MLSASAPGAAIAAFPLAFTNYAAQLGLGMQPNFSATPPPVKIDFSSVYLLGNNGGSAFQCANAMAGIIDVWFRTGLAVNNSSGVTINWN